MVLSGATGQGVQAVLYRLLTLIKQSKEEEPDVIQAPVTRSIPRPPVGRKMDDEYAGWNEETGEYDDLPEDDSDEDAAGDDSDGDYWDDEGDDDGDDTEHSGDDGDDRGGKHDDTAKG